MFTLISNSGLDFPRQSTTNIMLQQLARDKGMKVEERPIDFEKEIEDFKEVGDSLQRLFSHHF